MTFCLFQKVTKIKSKRRVTSLTDNMKHHSRFKLPSPGVRQRQKSRFKLPSPGTVTNDSMIDAPTAPPL